MNTFSSQQENRRKKTQSLLGHDKTKAINQLTLTQKGLNQACRNDSKQIWKIFYNFQEETDAESEKQIEDKQSFHQLHNKQLQYKIDKQKQCQQRISFDKVQNNKEINVKAKKSQNALKQEQNKNEENRKESFLKKMNQQIAKHLQVQKHASRSLSNTAFAKLYNRPCVQSYGYKNTSKLSQTTHNFLKTHNITPHTNQNKPLTYQTYSNAIFHAKRTKINQQSNQQKIRRQFLKYFDQSMVQAAQLELNKLNKQKRAKSLLTLKAKPHESQNLTIQNSKNQLKQKRKSLKQQLKNNEPIFIYKYREKDGNVKYSKDRHGLTCYVDSSFSANENSLINFEKKLNPIFSENIKPQDLNLDDIRKQNYKKSIQQDFPGHYMIPCVVTPYDRTKYQFRKNRAEQINQ